MWEIFQVNISVTFENMKIIKEFSKNKKIVMKTTSVLQLLHKVSSNEQLLNLIVWKARFSKVPWSHNQRNKCYSFDVSLHSQRETSISSQPIKNGSKQTRVVDFKRGKTCAGNWVSPLIGWNGENFVLIDQSTRCGTQTASDSAGEGAVG